jgi:hypothetical protein
VLARYTGLSQLDQRWLQLGPDDARWDEFCADLKMFAAKLAAAMCSLPYTPKRGTVAEPNQFWAAMIPIQESYKVLRRLSYIWAMGWRYREQNFTMPPYRVLALFKEKYGAAHAKFQRLDRWLYRRTPKGRAYQKAYDASPQVRARRIAHNTQEFRQREAERKRAARATAKALKESLCAGGDTPDTTRRETEKPNDHAHP